MVNIKSIKFWQGMTTVTRALGKFEPDNHCLGGLGTTHIPVAATRSRLSAAVGHFTNAL